MEDRGALFTAIMQYQTDEPLIELSPVAAVAWSFIREQIDRDTDKWQNTIEARREAGRLGGMARASNAKQTKQMLV